MREINSFSTVDYNKIKDRKEETVLIHVENKDNLYYVWKFI